MSAVPPTNATAPLLIANSSPYNSANHDEDLKRNNLRAEEENYTTCTLCCPSALACCLSVIFPCVWCGACTTLREREESVLLNFGKFMGTLRQPGIYCINSCGVTEKRVSTAINTIDLPDVKTADLNGNPILISGIINYSIIDSRKAVLDCNDVHTFIKTQGLAVMKRVASQFPYEARKPVDFGGLSASAAHHDEHNDCLKGENHRVRSMLVSSLQEKVNPCGARIISFDLSDLSYAPEIAQAMLIRQQADAMLEARKVIVAGAVEITSDVLRSLEKRGIVLDTKDQATLTNNLLVSICSEKSAQPTLSLTTSGK